MTVKMITADEMNGHFMSVSEQNRLCECEAETTINRNYTDISCVTLYLEQTISNKSNVVKMWQRYSVAMLQSLCDHHFKKGSSPSFKDTQQLMTYTFQNKSISFKKL